VDDGRTRREPLKPLVFAILLALSEEDRHGFGIMQDVNRRLKRRAVLGPGTLYRTLKELREAGLVAHAPSAADADPRRRFYRLTPKGRSAARAEAARMAAWIDLAKSGRLLDAKSGE